MGQSETFKILLEKVLEKNIEKYRAWGDFHTGEKLIQGIFCLYKIFKKFQKFQRITNNVLKFSTENQII
jgi:hypothetical protein